MLAGACARRVAPPPPLTMHRNLLCAAFLASHSPAMLRRPLSHLRRVWCTQIPFPIIGRCHLRGTAPALPSIPAPWCPWQCVACRHVVGCGGWRVHTAAWAAVLFLVPAASTNAQTARIRVYHLVHVAMSSKQSGPRWTLFCSCSSGMHSLAGRPRADGVKAYVHQNSMRQRRSGLIAAARGASKRAGPSSHCKLWAVRGSG
jgi:hypothetical protein